MNAYDHIVSVPLDQEHANQSANGLKTVLQQLPCERFNELLLEVGLITLSGKKGSLVGGFFNLGLEYFKILNKANTDVRDPVQAQDE